jgi:putative drug exporter of the RND superfamily
MCLSMFSIIGSLAVLRGLTLVTDVSTFALNLVTALGMALAIDYGLLIVSRYREERYGGAAHAEALHATLQTAGRTVLFSAVTVILALTGLLVFPMYFLKTFAYAGAAVVTLSAAAALILLPALLTLFGDRIDALDVRRWVRRKLGRPAPPTPSETDNFWYRSAKAVMRRPLLTAIPIVALLLFAATPALHMAFGFGDDRALPQNLPSRQVGDAIRADFPPAFTSDIQVVIPNAEDVTPSDLENYAGLLSEVDRVVDVSSPAGVFVEGARTGPALTPDLRDGAALFSIQTSANPFTSEAKSQLGALHEVQPPRGVDPLFGGPEQINRDSVAGITAKLPLALGLIAAATFILMFLLTGSVVLPIKALILNTLSLTATFGALVWIFQDGHLGGFGTTPTGALAATMVLLMFCIAFGLSMDYEVFLVSRIREYWLASARRTADNEKAVALGVARAARVVTAAALVMSISFAALIASQVSFMRMFGLGLTIAILVDATLVRMVLLPAAMKVMGRFNWWAPAPLARLHERWGLSDEAPPAGLRAAAIPKERPDR